MWAASSSALASELVSSIEYPAARRRVSAAADDLREERVRDVADREADRHRLLPPQALGEQVWLVPELAHRREHAPAIARLTSG